MRLHNLFESATTGITFLDADIGDIIEVEIGNIGKNSQWMTSEITGFKDGKWEVTSLDTGSEYALDPEHPARWPTTNEANPVLDEGPNDPHIFKAVFLAGGPGSGKSFVAGKLLKGGGLKVVNSDDIYEYLMKKKDMPLDPETIFSPKGQEVRGKAKELTSIRKGGFLDGRLGLIIDGTGKDVDKVRRESEALKSLGYDTMMLFVNTSLDVAQERNMNRERSIDPKEVEKMWNKVQQNLMKFQQVFGASNFHVLDNSGGLEDPTRAQEFNNVYKAVQKFINTPPQSHIARQWLEQNK